VLPSKIDKLEGTDIFNTVRYLISRNQKSLPRAQSRRFKLSDRLRNGWAKAHFPCIPPFTDGTFAGGSHRPGVYNLEQDCAKADIGMSCYTEVLAFDVQGGASEETVLRVELWDVSWEKRRDEKRTARRLIRVAWTLENLPRKSDPHLHIIMRFRITCPCPCLYLSCLAA
jgi:hypothetical protein